MSLDIDQVDVADIVADSMKVVSQAAGDRGIALSRHGPSRLMIEADRRALKQIFLNLLSNAVKFTREDGTVDVHLSRSKGIVRIAIKDTGIGIPEIAISSSWDARSSRSENQFSKSHQGSGLGLAISRALVELHGGSLRITSREGQGTTVICTLPVKAVMAEDEERASKRPSLLDPLTARSARRRHAPLRACPSGSLRASGNPACRRRAPTAPSIRAAPLPARTACRGRAAALASDCDRA